MYMSKSTIGIIKDLAKEYGIDALYVVNNVQPLKYKHISSAFPRYMTWFAWINYLSDSSTVVFSFSRSPSIIQL